MWHEAGSVTDPPASSVNSVVQGKTSMLVVGVGSRYRGDDAAGLAVAALVRERAPDGIEVLTHEGEGVGLMERLAECDTAILIDAMLSGAEPGAVRRFDANAIPLPARAFRHSTHAIGLADAIELGRALGKLPHRIIVYGIEAKESRQGNGLSPEVEDSVNRVAGQVLAELLDQDSP